MQSFERPSEMMKAFGGHAEEKSSRNYLLIKPCEKDISKKAGSQS
jgi:hypothetical protein